LKAYRKEGFVKIPESIKKATQEYRDECDTLQEFIDDEYAVGIENKCKLSELRKVYNRWLKENHCHHAHYTPQELRKQLIKKGIEVMNGKVHTNYCYGIELPTTGEKGEII
jgi:phage/plasmid-associated DNA primase